MTNPFLNTRPVLVAAAIAALGLAVGCNVNNELLQPQNPGIVDASAVGSAAAAAALKVGAIGRWRLMAVGSETLWPESGHLADEFMNADFQNDRNDVDQRTMSTNNPYANYGTITQARGFVRDALTAELKYEPQKTSDIGELWLALAHLEMSLAENFCNGIPLGFNKSGDVGGYAGPEFKPLTNLEVLNVALTHLDSANLALGSASDNASVFVRQAVTIVKARILVDEGQFAAAAALVPTSAIPTNYQYMWTTSTASNSDDGAVWTLNNSVSRVSVSDSTVVYAGKTFTTLNAIPFASIGDPRVPVVTGLSLKLTSEDGATPLFVQQLWKGRDDPIAVVSGVDARLIEAEAKLNAGDFAGMMTILNALRTGGQTLGILKVPVMAALTTTPATADAATSLFFREKAFWTFGRGQRLNDLRRLVRQYKRTQDKVFPNGQHYKGGNYGTDVNFPVPDQELVNPQFHGCIDRSA